MTPKVDHELCGLLPGTGRGRDIGQDRAGRANCEHLVLAPHTGYLGIGQGEGRAYMREIILDQSQLPSPLRH